MPRRGESLIELLVALVLLEIIAENPGSPSRNALYDAVLRSRG